MITVTFQCGHKRTADGGEEQMQCACGETRVAQVDAPMPRFRGHVRGPHTEFKELEAKAVTFGGEKT